MNAHLITKLTMTNKKKTNLVKKVRNHTAEHENRKPLFEKKKEQTKKKTPKEKEKEKRNGRHTPTC